MNTSEKEVLGGRALALVEEHLGWINEGDLAAARRQLFSPAGLTERPLDVYLKCMGELAPFEVISIAVGGIEDVREKRHGRVATVWVNVVVHCSLGQKSAEIAVWWFPENDRYQISARPSHWISGLLPKASPGAEPRSTD